MKKVLSVLLIFMLLFSAVYAFPFEQALAEEAEPVYEPDTYLPEEEYTEEIYEGTGSLEYAFDGTFIRDYVDNETLDEAGHVARINEEEALNTYVFLNRDGTKSVYYMDDNVRYVDENGETVEKDLTIIRKNKGYTLKANDVKLWFPDVLSDGISVKYDKYHLTLYPQGVADTEEVIIDEYERITYPGVFGENTVLAYTPTLSGLKEDIILSEYTGQLSYDFLIHTHGMRILEEDGKYIVKKPGNGNKESFELGAVQIYDSAGNFCVGEMKITEQNNGSKYILTLIAPEEFLTDPDTVYPVTIDPTITVSGPDAIEDSVVYSGTPNTNYGGFTFLTVGYGDSTYGVGRAVFRLNALNTNTTFLSLSADNIISATFHTWDGTGTTGRTVNLYELGSYMWTESGITWNNCPSHVDTIMSSASLPGAAYSTFDITNLVKKWRTGSSAHFGFILINPDETNSANKKVPCSSEYSYTDRRPYAVVTYSLTSNISSTTDKLYEGGTLNLSVTSNNAIRSVAWTSSNTSLATVTSSGASTAIVTGIKAGRVVITANITFTDNTTQTIQKVIYVCIRDGVYYIQNDYTKLYLKVEDGKINGLPKVHQYTKITSGTDRLSQLWKIYYLGEGFYSIRPLHRMTMALDVTGSNVDVYNVGNVDSLGALPDCVEWTIDYYYTGYEFRNKGLDNKTMQVKDASTAVGASVIASTYTANLMRNRWDLEKIDSPVGVLLYDTSTQTVVQNPTRYVAPNETLTLSDLDLLATAYSGITLSQVFSWTSSDESVATVDSSTGTVTGVSPGQVTITGRKTIYTNLTLSFTLIVTEIPNGTYYIHNKKTARCVDIDGSLMTEGALIHQYEYRESSSQRWVFAHLGDGVYSIASASNTSFYLGVEDDSENSNVAIILRAGELTDGMKWSIEKTNSNAYKIISKTDEDNDKVLAVNSHLLNINGVDIIQNAFDDDLDYDDEWQIATPFTVGMSTDDYTGECSHGDRGSKYYADSFFEELNDSPGNAYFDRIHHYNKDLNITASKNDFSVNGAISDDIDFMIYIGHGLIAKDSRGNRLHYNYDSEGNAHTTQHDGSQFNAYNTEMHFGSDSSNLRWVWLYTCNFLTPSEYVADDTFIEMMTGAHIVLGYASTTTLCESMSDKFASYLKDGRTIIDAFFLAGEKGEAQETSDNNTQKVLYFSQAFDETIYSPWFNYDYTTDDIMIITKGIQDET